MKEDGAEEFYEVGAGRVLSGLLKRTLGREISCTAVGSYEQCLALDADKK